MQKGTNKESINLDERLKDAAIRELHEETGLKISNIHQFHVFDTPGRDPREIITRALAVGKI